jgi:Na+-transporting methylmalonyl-CoA/oxaloacetate decarboxylase gamma subunit
MVQEGLIIMIVGMLTVFLFLIILVILMQAMSKILMLYPGAPLIQKDSNEANEQIAALYALAYHQSQTQKTNNSEVGK